jgi:23S rRNA (adenine2503-C2)-methyltransferase
MPKPSGSSGGLDTPQRMLALYRPDLSAKLAEHLAPSFRYGQVYEHLLRRPQQPFAQATTLPADARELLDGLGISSLELAGTRVAADGTAKLLLAGGGGAYVETVIMPYRKRTTVCISSQVGCPVGCLFCATGAAGFRRNLSVAEIVDQVRAAAALQADEGGRLSNVVYMGMGEPLLNLQAVLDSIRVLTDPRGMNLAHRAISVSTVGIPAGILRLGRAEPQVNLAVSLHASNDRTRALLIPKNHCHPLAEVLAASWEHFDMTRRKLLVEYVLLRGVNDSREDAKRLANLLRGHVVSVNLLLWNPVPGPRAHRAGSPSRSGSPRDRCAEFQPSPPANVAAFRDALLQARIEAVVRQGRGAEIEAACGQLAGRNLGYSRKGDE